ncbi:MAG: hypothetical protein K0Q53_1701 [Massilibacillus sp.]|jgi:hypothetical protein|nr:hypothetical protein [Massilibacillus sp.]
MLNILNIFNEIVLAKDVLMIVKMLIKMVGFSQN